MKKRNYHASVNAESIANNKITPTSIPHTLMNCGYEGIAASVVFLACADIIRFLKAKRAHPEKMFHGDLQRNYDTAVAFLLRPNNVVNILELPGSELIKYLEEIVNGKDKSSNSNSGFLSDPAYYCKRKYTTRADES